jgi:hypothetical protein
VTIKIYKFDTHKKMKKYASKLYRTNGKRETFRTTKQKRFLKNIRMINWQSGICKVYLKVSYGKEKCVSGCICEFFNDTYCYNKEELLDMFNYFNKEEL